MASEAQGAVELFEGDGIGEVLAAAVAGQDSVVQGEGGGGRV